ncbi:hypothetical protein SK128_006519 [Halocaridina rubra]|uniref:ZP domain-containing protein n=1 Tax=Halocaridina rubra TaxID=373956 RepID=A0AAN8ZSP8_HALRR
MEVLALSGTELKRKDLWIGLLSILLYLSGAKPSESNHHTLFVTVPTTSTKRGYDMGEETTTWSYEEEVDTPTDAAFLSSSRSALLRVPPSEAKVIFLADDYEAASRIPELLPSLSGKVNSVVDSPLFPNTRARPSLLTTTETGDIADHVNNFVENDPLLKDSHVPRTRSEEEIESRHSTSLSYRPGSYHLTQRFPPHRPRPLPPRIPQGSPVIDKEDIFHNNIYSGRPGSSYKRPFRNMTRVQHIEAECQDDFMRINVQFNGTFDGLIYSSGYAYDGDCIYVNGSGRSHYDFFIQLNRCGTLSGNEKGREDVRGRSPTKNMMWNTLTVQYNAMIEEEWDEHFKVTCEYGYDFWKTVTFPFLDVEVQTGNPVVFSLTPPECHMEIRYGYGTAGTRVTGPVRVGDPLTLIIYMRSDFEGFDIVVSDCHAHNGGNKRITLIDHYGCPVDEKLISHFEGTWTADEVFETQVYAFMKTFRFTGSPALYIECDVRMCHGDCPTQPCHWRRGKKEKRSIPDQKEEILGTKTTTSGNVSGSLSLFQSIQVVRDDYMAPSTINSPVTGEVCLKNGTFSALAGIVAVIVGLLASSTGVMCLRLKRLKSQEENAPSPTRAIPYTTHYKSDFVPATKRRLE